MSSRGSGSGRLEDAALSELEQGREALEKSQQLETEIERADNEVQLRIDDSLAQNRVVEYGRTSNASSALLNLPTEVICLIFYFSVTCHVLVNPRNEKLAWLPEVVVSHVCRRWRDVAINHPPLWTRFCFALDGIGPSMENSLARFDTYLERSGSRNLELALDMRQRRVENEQMERPPDAQQRQLLDMAIKQIHRWKTVTLIPDRHMCVEDYFSSLLTASAPNLEHFAYAPDYYVDREDTPREMTSLATSLLQGGTPNLRYLLLNGGACHIPSLSNVTTLRIEFNGNRYVRPAVRYSMDTFLEMLSIPSLANLSITGNIFSDVDPYDDIPSITMNNLQHLRYGYNELMTYILPFIRAPLLQTLVIHSVDLNGASGYEYSRNTRRATADPYFFPSLHTLSVINFTPTFKDAAWRIMRLTKNIKTLTVSQSDGEHDDLLGVLRERGPFFTVSNRNLDDDDGCWRNLTCANVNVHYLYDRRFRIVWDFARSRLKHSFKLRLFKKVYSGWRAMYPGDFEWMRKGCTVEPLDDDEEVALMTPSWPPGVDFPLEAFIDDRFRFSREG